MNWKVKTLNLIVLIAISSFANAQTTGVTLKWALSEEQDYIHPFGFLQLETKLLANK
jgi:hypothetical protein